MKTTSIGGSEVPFSHHTPSKSVDMGLQPHSHKGLRVNIRGVDKCVDSFLGPA